MRNKILSHISALIHAVMVTTILHVDKTTTVVTVTATKLN